jgi:hypothetical protein
VRKNDCHGRCEEVTAKEREAVGATAAGENAARSLLSGHRHPVTVVSDAAAGQSLDFRDGVEDSRMAYGR